MVLENEYCSNTPSVVDGERRSVESRQLSYQKIQESNDVAKNNNKRARESGNNATSGQNNNNKSNGSWGPVFKNRQNFNDMHMF